LDLERRGLRRRGGGFWEGNKSGFSSLGQDDLLCLLGTFSFFQPSMGVSHDDLVSDFILEATDKVFPEETIYHSLHAKIQVLKGNNKIFHCYRLFQLGQTS
jgi:hypothetical protein